MVQEYLLHHLLPLLPFGFVNQIGQILPDHGLVGGDDDHVQSVYLPELEGFGLRGSRHTCELFVEFKVVLEGNGGEGLVFLLHLYPFLDLDRLMESVRPPPSGEDPSRELVDYEHLAVPDDVVNVPLEEVVRLYGLNYGVEEVYVLEVIEVIDVKHPLDLRYTLFGKRYVPVLLVDVEVPVPLQFSHHPVRHPVYLYVHLSRSGDYEGRPCLVYQYGVDLVHYGVGVSLDLNHLLLGESHVVPQIIEAELVVCSVGNVRAVSVPTVHLPEDGEVSLLGFHVHLFGGKDLLEEASGPHPQILLHRLPHLILVSPLDPVGQTVGVYNPHVQTQKPEDGTHPLGVPASQIIVDGYYVNPLIGHAVDRRRQSGDEGLTLPRLHLRYLSLMEDETSYELNVEVSESEGSFCCFPHKGENLHHLVGYAPPEDLLPQILRQPYAVVELLSSLYKLVVWHLVEPALEFVHPPHEGSELLYLTLVLRSQYPLNQPSDHAETPKFFNLISLV